MSPPVYFDTSVFLAILKPESTARQIRALLKDLQDQNIRIYTSILTLQEASVLGFRRGTPARDNYSRITKIARIVGITPDVALTAAKLEAQISDRGAETEITREEKKRRKWDCFHIATAQVYRCSAIYSEDKAMPSQSIKGRNVFNAFQPFVEALRLWSYGRIQYAQSAVRLSHPKRNFGVHTCQYDC